MGQEWFSELCGHRGDTTDTPPPTLWGLRGRGADNSPKSLINERMKVIFSFFYFLVGLGFELRAWHLQSRHYCLSHTSMLEMVVLRTICLGWPRTLILQISASHVAGITGVTAGLAMDLFRDGSCYVTQAGLELLGANHLPASASQQRTTEPLCKKREPQVANALDCAEGKTAAEQPLCPRMDEWTHSVAIHTGVSGSDEQGKSLTHATPQRGGP
jgi:hypothetical protein